MSCGQYSENVLGVRLWAAAREVHSLSRKDHRMSGGLEWFLLGQAALPAHT